MAGEFGDGVWYVDLAPITDPELVPVTVARALGLPDQPGRSTMDTLLRFVRDRQMLVVLDNCEHLLDASAELVVALLGGAPGLTLLATSREPIGVAGEVSWRVPSLSLADEAIELFADRARRARPDFAVTDDNAAAVGEICARLDGVPLAIELAAARVRALSLAEILDSLHDRFRLLTGGARTAVRRQQTLRASVDWSHALLTEPERVLFRRLAVFLGGFDLDAAQAVAGGGEVERYQVLDQLTLLVDKSLVVADDSRGPNPLPAAGDGAPVRAGKARRIRRGRRRAGASPRPLHGDGRRCSTRRQAVIMSSVIEQAETEIDNLRAAFAWSRENSDVELALALASSLQPLWLARGRLREGLAWFDAALTDLDAQHPEVAPAVRARALADRAVLDHLGGRRRQPGSGPASPGDRARSRRPGPAGPGADRLRLHRRRLRRRGGPGRTSPRRSAWPGRWTIGGGSARSWPAGVAAAIIAGDPIAARAAAEEGRDLADAIGDRFDSRRCRLCLGMAQLYAGRSGRSRRTVRRGGGRGRGGSRCGLRGARPRQPGHRAGLPG